VEGVVLQEGADVGHRLVAVAHGVLVVVVVGFQEGLVGTAAGEHLAGLDGEAHAVGDEVSEEGGVVGIRYLPSTFCPCTFKCVYCFLSYYITRPLWATVYICEKQLS
jgi:hypothetical protein